MKIIYILFFHSVVVRERKHVKSNYTHMKPIILYLFSLQGAIVTSLKDLFKDFRRTPVEKGKSKSNPRKSPKKKRPGITQPLSEPLPAPEDSVSFERHLRVLHVEFTKMHRNKQVVADLMDRTFALRRKAILEKPHDLDGLFHHFPISATE